MLSSIFDIINVPIGYLLRFCYQLVSNYGLAIILVGIITKILLVPLAVKQQKGSLAQMKFGPRVREIQQKYATDKDRQQREMAKLQAEGYSPTAGCSTLLIQFPIIIGIYNVIRHPLKYIVGLSDTVLASLATRLATLPGFESITVKSPNFEVSAISAIGSNYNKFADILNGTKYFSINLDMFGLNLANIPPKMINILGILPIPSFTSWLVIIPLLSALTAAVATILTQKIGPAASMNSDPSAQQNKATMGIMNIIGPYMSYAVAMAVPAGLGVYWIISNILTVIQTIVLNKFYNPLEYKKKLEEEEIAKKNKNKKKAQIDGAPAQDVIEQTEAPVELSSKVVGKGSEKRNTKGTDTGSSDSKIEPSQTDKTEE